MNLNVRAFSGGSVESEFFTIVELQGVDG